MKPDRAPVPPLAAVFFAILCVSTASIFIRYAQREASSIVISAARLTLAALILAPLALVKHRNELKALKTGEWVLALLSGIFLALHFATWITSLAYTSVASSVVMVSTAPLWVALLSPVLLKEKISRFVALGLALALIGGAVVGLSDTCTLSGFRLNCPPFASFIQGNAFLGDLLALAGALAVAFYLVAGRKLREGTSLVSYIFVVYSMGALVLLALVLIRGEQLAGYSPQTYFWLMLLAVVPQLLGHSTFNWALRYFSAAFVAVTLLGEPIGSTILAYFLLDETPTTLKIFGAILILSGIYIASTFEARKK